MVQWGPATDAAVFKHVLSIHQVKVNHEEVAKAMRAEGIQVTAKALIHRFAKLRNTPVPTGETLAAINGTGSDNKSPSAGTDKPAPAKKGGKKRDAESMSTTTESGNISGGSHDEVSADSVDEGAGDVADSGTKKARAKKPKGEAKPKSPRAKKAKSKNAVVDQVTEVTKGEDEMKVKAEEDQVKEEEGLVEMRFEEGI